MESKVNPGDKVPKPSASFHNDLVDLLNKTKSAGLNKPQQPKHTPRNYNKVKVRNGTGSDLGRGRVLELTSFLLDELEQDYLWFYGEVPDLEHAPWGITLKPIPSGDIDEILIEGVCLATINFISDSHKFARRIVGSTILESADRGGVKILQDPGGGSERECVVQILDDTPLWYLGITREDFTQGEDVVFAIDVWAWDTDVEEFRKVPGFVIEAQDWFLNSEEEVEKGTKVRVDWYISTWVVTAMYCSPTDLEEHGGSRRSPGADISGDWSPPYDLGGYGGSFGGDGYAASYSGSSSFESGGGGFVPLEE